MPGGGMASGSLRNTDLKNYLREPAFKVFSLDFWVDSVVLSLMASRGSIPRPGIEIQPYFRDGLVVNAGKLPPVIGSVNSFYLMTAGKDRH
jgi:hypothetical protein